MKFRAFFFKLVSVLSPISFLLTVWRKGEFVGEDSAGNRYYRAAPRKGYRHEQRWVLYKDEACASFVPPLWHGWLHHQSDIVPSAEACFANSWQGRTPANKGDAQPAAVYKEGNIRTGNGPKYQPWSPE